MSLFNSPGGSLFGTNTNNQIKPTPFGTTSSQPSSAGTLFGTAQPQQQSTSLFGSNSNNTSQTQTGSGLFGGSSNPPVPSSSGGLFGSTVNTGNNAQSSAPSLFGSNTQTSGQTGLSTPFGTTSNQAGGSSLFGGANQPSGQQTGGLFGQSTQQQQKPTLSLFGSNTQSQNQNQPQPKPSLSLFGTNNQQQQTQQQQQTGNSLFGSSSVQARPLSLSLGQAASQNTQQQTVPGVKIDVSNIRGITRFSDLHDTIQDGIIQIDNLIAKQIQFKDQCEALMPAHGANIASLAPDVSYISGLTEAVEAGIYNDGVSIKSLKQLIAKDADDARRCFRAIENLKLPSAYHYSGAGVAFAGHAQPQSTSDDSADDAASADLTSYFESLAAEMRATLAGYTSNLAEIEQHLGTVEAGSIAQGQALAMRSGARSAEDQVRELAGVLREFEQGILGVAGRVGAAREAVETAISRGSR